MPRHQVVGAVLLPGGHIAVDQNIAYGRATTTILASIYSTMVGGLWRANLDLLPGVMLLCDVTSQAWSPLPTNLIVDNDNAAEVFQLAAPCLIGWFSFLPEEAGAVARGAINLPFFDKGDIIDIRLGYHGLALPPAGVFAKLTVLNLENIHFHGHTSLGDVLSSARCPSLKSLCVHGARGLSSLTFHSKTLLDLALHHLQEFEQLTVVMPMLRKLDIFNNFENRQPVADVTTPVLELLHWFDNKKSCLWTFVYSILDAFSGIKKLDIKIFGHPTEKAACSPSSDCHQLQESENEELSLNSLQEVEISKYTGGEYEHAFLKRLMRWAPALKKDTITFDPSVTIVTEELCQELLRLPRPELHEDLLAPTLG
ncbi:hypothetical protein EJB05_14768, partial [Eragrostis curvula]